MTKEKNYHMYDDEYVDKLEKENAELKKELQDYQFNYDNIKELTNENAELKAQIEKMKDKEKRKNFERRKKFVKRYSENIHREIEKFKPTKKQVEKVFNI